MHQENYISQDNAVNFSNHEIYASNANNARQEKQEKYMNQASHMNQESHMNHENHKIYMNHENHKNKILQEYYEDNSEKSKEVLWKTNIPYNGYDYFFSIAQGYEVDDVCEVVNAEEILEVWHLFRMPIHDILQKSIQYTMCAENQQVHNPHIENLHTNNQCVGNLCTNIPCQKGLCQKIPCQKESQNTEKLCNHTIIGEGISKHILRGRGLTYSLYRENEHKQEILGMGGLVPFQSMGNTVAEIWFIGADMNKHSRFLARHVKEILALFFQEYPILINVVGTWNKRSIRWLEYLGFFVEKTPQYMGANQALFHRFYMTKQMFDKKMCKEELCV